LVKKKYALKSLPSYLTLTMRRFSKNSFFTEKNPTIVSFPIKSLDLSEYVEKGEKEESYVYDLIGNVIHDGKAGTGSYRV
jgi:U4/U6.U5 tri-snRNP-associated protein 2